MVPTPQPIQSHMTSPNKRIVKHIELAAAAGDVASELSRLAVSSRLGIVYVYAVPRGGVPAFYLVLGAFMQIDIVRKNNFRLELVDDPEHAEVILDDLVDSGKTAQRMRELNPRAHFKALIHKGPTTSFPLGEWLVFPWEGSEEKSIEDSFIRLLQFIGEDPARGGLLETPARMAKAWQHWTSGYKGDPVALLKTFEDGGEVYDEMVHVRSIPFYSQCEHHLAPFFGDVTFAYIPDKKVVGLSKMNRLVDVFARRLQVQERLTHQIVDEFCKVIKPKGAGIMVRARHMCVESRGVQHRNCETTTSSFRGVLKEGVNSIAARAEFFSLCRQ